MEEKQENKRIKTLGLKFKAAGASGKKVHVMSREGQWVVFKEGARKVISEYATKRSAVHNGRKIAISNSADSLVIHKIDGTVDRRVLLVE